jgi:hypothetical protein
LGAFFQSLSYIKESVIMLYFNIIIIIYGVIVCACINHSFDLTDKDSIHTFQVWWLCECLWSKHWHPLVVHSKIGVDGFYRRDHREKGSYWVPDTVWTHKQKQMRIRFRSSLYLFILSYTHIQK